MPFNSFNHSSPSFANHFPISNLMYIFWISWKFKYFSQILPGYHTEVWIKNDFCFRFHGLGNQNLFFHCHCEQSAIAEDEKQKLDKHTLESNWKIKSSTWWHRDRDIFGFVTGKGEWIFGFVRYAITSNAGKVNFGTITSVYETSYEIPEKLFLF